MSREITDTSAFAVCIGTYSTVLWFYRDYVKISSFSGPKRKGVPLVEVNRPHEKGISIAAKAMRSGQRVEEFGA